MHRLPRNGSKRASVLVALAAGDKSAREIADEIGWIGPPGQQASEAVKALRVLESKRLVEVVGKRGNDLVWRLRDRATAT